MIQIITVNFLRHIEGHSMYIFSQTVYFRRNKWMSMKKGKYLGFSWVLYNDMRTEILFS